MAGKLQTQISFDRRRGRIDATAYQDDRLVAVVHTSASTHGRRRVMRVDEAQGQHEALEALVREVGEVSCRTDGRNCRLHLDDVKCVACREGE